MKIKQIGAFTALLFAATASSQAAFISVDDSDPNTITITAGDFEGGFSVNGTLLTTGLGNSGSVTLPDAGYTFDGSWIDLGETKEASNAHLYFADASDPTAVKSGIQALASSDGFNGSLSGSTFGGYNGNTYFFAPDTFSQDSGTQTTGLPFLSISFTPEVSAPDAGSTALLLGLATLGLGTVRRARK